MPPLRHAYLAVGIFVASVALGCGDGIEVGAVGGTVLLDGRPLEGATVLFTPESGGRPSAGRTDASGRYELTYTDDLAGALPGTHAISISTFRKGDPDSGRPPAAEKVPAQFNARTELKRIVEADDNVIDFELTSPRRVATRR